MRVRLYSIAVVMLMILSVSSITLAQAPEVINPLAVIQPVESDDPLKHYYLINPGVPVGDLNGDGYLEFMLEGEIPRNIRDQNSEFGYRTMLVTYERESLFLFKEDQTDLANQKPMYQAGDFDGDGLDELIRMNNGQFELVSYASDFASSSATFSPLPSEINSESNLFIANANFDGDNFQDVVACVQEFDVTPSCTVIFGANQETESAVLFDIPFADAGIETFVRYQLIAADMYGDSTPELLMIWTEGFTRNAHLTLFEYSGNRSFTFVSDSPVGETAVSADEIRLFAYDLDQDGVMEALYSDDRRFNIGFSRFFFRPPSAFYVSIDESGDSPDFGSHSVLRENSVIDTIIEPSEDFSSPGITFWSDGNLTFVDGFVLNGLAKAVNEIPLITDQSAIPSSRTSTRRKIDIDQDGNPDAINGTRDLAGRIGIGATGTRISGQTVPLYFNVRKIFGIGPLVGFSFQEPVGKEVSKIGIEISGDVGLGLAYTNRTTLSIIFGVDIIGSGAKVSISGERATVVSPLGDQARILDFVSRTGAGAGAAIVAMFESLGGDEVINLDLTGELFGSAGFTVWFNKENRARTDTTALNSAFNIRVNDFQEFSNRDILNVRMGNIGDIDNNGVDDIILTSGFASGPEGAINKGWIFLDDNGILPSMPDITLELNQDSLLDNSTFMNVGQSISPLGDVNGDGVDDFAFGMPNYNSVDSVSGAVFVYFGSESISEKMKDLNNSLPDLVLRPRVQSNQNIFSFGTSISGGDFDGDGFNDVAAVHDFGSGSIAAPTIQIFKGGQNMDAVADYFLYATREQVGSVGSDTLNGGFDHTVHFMPKETGSEKQDLYFTPGAFSGRPDALIFTGGADPSPDPSYILREEVTPTGSGTSRRTKPAAADLNGDGYYEIMVEKQFDNRDAYLSSRVLVFSPNSGIINSVNEENELINTYQLDQNYPNPFNPSTNIQFELPVASNVTLRVFNILGQEVATLINNERLTAGTQVVPFNASNLASGVYLYRIEAGNFVKTRKMTLIK